jgi:hypothetical protein
MTKVKNVNERGKYEKDIYAVREIQPKFAFCQGRLDPDA